MPEGLEISDGGFDEQVAAPPSSSSSKKKVIIGATILAVVAAVAIAIGVVVGGSSSNNSNEETVSISAMKNDYAAYEDHGDLPFVTRSHDSSHSYSRSQKPVSVTVVVFPLVMSGISIIGLLLMSYVQLRFSRDYINSHAYAPQKNFQDTPCL